MNILPQPGDLVVLASLLIACGVIAVVWDVLTGK